MTRPDPPIPDEQMLALGRNLRGRRKALGLTLAQVAQLADLSTTFVSQVERGRHRPSVPTLHRLAKALETNAYTMLIPPSPAVSRFEINRSATRTAFEQEDDVPSSRAMPLVTAGNQLRVIEVSGGPVTWQGPFVHRNDEFMYVLAGEIEIDLDGSVDKLAAGDSLLYSGGMTLRWRALSVETRVVIVIVDDGLTHGA
jgi:transcriptional regulator with XRE-family HTH domain